MKRVQDENSDPFALDPELIETREQAKDRASVAVVLSVLVLVAVVVLCPIVGALVEGISRWEQSFPLK